MERPIILKAHEVRGILENRQTQLRRIIKPNLAPDRAFPERNEFFYLRGYSHSGAEYGAHVSADRLLAKCPYGQPGDRLWVRETWRAGNDPGSGSVFYRADEEWNKEAGWTSSVQMPRRMCRILLKIVSVRVERLADMRLRDYEAQGYLTEPTEAQKAVELWRELWDADNSKGSWDANPWVWAVEFKRVEASQ